MSSPLLRVVVVWAWNPLGAALTAMTMVLLLMAFWQRGFSEAVSAVMERPYLFSYVEVVAAGLLHLVLTVACKEDFAAYGLTKRGLGRSTGLSVIIAMIPLTLDFLTKRRLRLEGGLPRSQGPGWTSRGTCGMPRWGCLLTARWRSSTSYGSSPTLTPS